MTRDVVDELNRALPAAAHAKLGDALRDIIQALNGINAAPAALVTYIDSLAGMIDELATRFDTASARINALEAQIDALCDKLDADTDITATNWLSTIIPTPLTALVTDTQADLNADAVDAAGSVTLSEVTPVLTLAERAAGRL